MSFSDLPISPPEDVTTTPANPSDTSSETHSDLEDMWDGFDFDHDPCDGWDPAPIGGAALPVSVDPQFDDRQAVCLGTEDVFDRVLATHDSDVLSRSFTTRMAMRRAAELAQA